MTDLVDQMFPPINRKWAPEYTDFNFWRAPIPDIELPELLSSPSSSSPLVTPPSPSLSASARSDVSVQSTLSRLRNFSLGRGRSTASSFSSSRAHSPDGSGSGSGSGSSSMVTPKDTPRDVYDNNNDNDNNLSNTTATATNVNGKHIRSAVSLDRLGSFLPSLGSTDSIIPSYHNRPVGKGEEGGGGGEDEIVFVPNGWGTTGYRKSRPGSMPGSLDLGPIMHDPRWLEGGEDEEEGEEEDGEVDGSGIGARGSSERGGGGAFGYGYTEEHGTEQSFDDDLIATGEMENVPYL